MLPIKRILCPTDFSEPSYEALDIAQEMALHFSSELYLVHVINPVAATIATSTAGTSSELIDGEVPMEAAYVAQQEELQTGSMESLKELIKERFPSELTVWPVVLNGDPAHEIVRFAAEKEMGLIVIATHGHTGWWRRLVFGSVVESVVQKADTPVLTIRPEKRAKDE